MALADDKPARDASDKDLKKAEPKPMEKEPRQLNRQELEALRWQLHKKFHRSSK